MQNLPRPHTRTAYLNWCSS